MEAAHSERQRAQREWATCRCRINIPGMTAIVGLVGVGDPNVEDRARLALGAMHASGSEHVELWHEPTGGAALGAVSDLWQIEGRGPDSSRLAFDERAVVATDASLYYLADLERLLDGAGHRAATRSPAALILAAYRAWGNDAVHRLEGDFALVVWDRLERRLVAARDHGGSRPLFYATYAGGLAIASRLDGLTALPGFDSALDLLSLGNDALVLRVHDPERTAYANVKRLPAGHRMDWRKDRQISVERFWEVPYFTRGDGPPYAEAVEELKRLIVASVAERTKHSGGGAVWLSGGYDSPALYAASHVAARENGLQPAQAISIQYPADDPGYEDNFITAATSFWSESPAWIHIANIPSIAAPLERARNRDEPLHHTYEQWNAALARETVARGRRVALIGNGGDQFFSSTTVRLADHLRAGRIVTLAREWREAGGGTNWRLFAREVVAPNLPDRVLSVATSLRQGRTLQHRLARPIPAWSRATFEHFDALVELNRTPLERRPGETHASLDQSWSLRQVTAERIVTLLCLIGLLEGVEVRSPLFDQRIIHFAAGRPLAESYSRRENKRLLRGAFKGLLPDSVLGPRAERTGLPTRYLKRTAAAHAEWAAARWLNGMILADLGVIEGRQFLDRTKEVSGQGIADLEEGVAIVAAVQTECWLRARQSAIKV
jgi:asparagine synthetase B (glutamine-hydrolysing)